MKKTLYAAGFLWITANVSAQVGVNTTAPKTTMDVSAKRDVSTGLITDNTQLIGLQAPRLTLAELVLLPSYGVYQKGALIYITAFSGGGNTGQRSNIDAEGYYYFDGLPTNAKWQKMVGVAASDTTNDAWINDTTNAMIKLGTNADGTTARTAGTDFVAKDNGNVGIGTASPDSYARLEIKSTNQGILIPRVSLTSTTMDLNSDGDNNVSNQPEGLLVYNMGTTLDKGTYFWDGAKWAAYPKKTAIVDFSDCSSIKVTGIYMTSNAVTDQVVKISVPVKVTTLGEYSYTAVVNGITFLGSGTFTSLGAQTVILSPFSGTPTNATANSYPATVTISPTKNNGTAGVTCTNILVPFLSRGTARMKIVYYSDGTNNSILTPANTSASTRTGQWLTGATMANPNGIAPAHTALYYSGTAAIDLVAVTESTTPAELQDALDTASIVFVGGEIVLSNAKSSLIEQWLKAGRGYFITMNDTTGQNTICDDLGYYLEQGAAIASQTVNTASYPQLFSQTAPNDAVFAITDGLSVGFQGSDAAYITSNLGSKFLVSSSGTPIRNTGYIDLAGNAFILGDKFGNTTGTTDQNFQRVLIDIFAYMLKNAPVYTN